jgi:4-aminobutyrate aminotransferase-like enzyme
MDRDSRNSSALLELEDKYIAAANRAKPAICWAKAHGTKVWDVDGREYLDFTSGVLVLAAGHSHPMISRAISEQAHELINCYASPHNFRGPLAQELLSIAGPPFDRVAFLTTGSEAIDGALKVARFVTGRPGILAFTGAFHGRTMAGVSVSGSPTMRAGLGSPVPYVYRAPYPYPYRWTYGTPVVDVALHMAEMAAEQAGPGQIGAILVEPFAGAGGVLPAPPQFMAGLRELADRLDALLILDEIQSGLGRCGDWFNFHNLGVVPDLVVGAKHLGGGLPIIAILGRTEHLEQLPAGSMTSTFGGNPLACAAAMATLQVLKQEDLVTRGARIGEMMLEEMTSWPQNLPSVGEVRGVGLSFGIELVTDGNTKEPAPTLAQAVTEAVWSEGLVLLPPAGVHGNVIRLAPPLVISDDEAMDGLSRLRSVLERIGSAQ